MKVVLIGYMASGKSTIGKFLAARLFVDFIDLDEYIEEKEKKTVSEIFEEEGEIYFRTKEHQYLKELLAKEEDFVLSVGGGTPCYAGNIDVINSAKNTTSIYLLAQISTLVERIERQKEKRPLVADISNHDLPEFIAKHLFERRYFYDKAKLKVKIDNKTIDEIVTELQIALH